MFLHMHTCSVSLQEAEIHIKKFFMTSKILSHVANIEAILSLISNSILFVQENSVRKFLSVIMWTFLYHNKTDLHIISVPYHSSPQNSDPHASPASVLHSQSLKGQFPEYGLDLMNQLAKVIPEILTNPLTEVISEILTNQLTEETAGILISQ